MWNILVLTVMVSLSGYYMTVNKNGPVVAVMPLSSPYAESMAIYREAVINWFSAPANRSLTNASVSLPTLSADGALPAWSNLSTSPSAGMWRNYRASNGMIYIYASPLPPVNILPDLIDISQNSALLGTYRAGDATLFSLSLGSTTVPIPPEIKAGANPILAGSPLWVASIR